MSVALDLLRRAIAAWDPASVALYPKPPLPTFEYAVWRFLAGWQQDFEGGTFGPDAAVLLRQVVRWSGGELRLPAIPQEARGVLSQAGVEVTPTGSLAAVPFNPGWIVNDRIDPAVGVDLPPRLARTDSPLPAERYLIDLSPGLGRQPMYTTWQSGAQKEAAWRALSLPAGSTCAVVLPTGTGKSLVFQLLAAHSQGLTVVVVPTVALAIDQWRAACEVVPALNPRYYAAGDDTDAVLDAVKQRQTRLLVTSPEACVSGKLRPLLGSLAATGGLDNLVIDEVHLVETWGAFFRVAFQVLSGVRDAWLEKSAGRLRTLLLTATLTPSGRDDLRNLFPPARGGVWWEFLSQRLRPEMVYFDRQFASGEARNGAVLETVWHLPRPAILYVTEKAEAIRWHKRLLKEQGFHRLGCFHGDTPPAKRRALLDAWRSDRIDLMVATSAFGLGVDKPDVRSIIHACYPEDMNRYYQEVGRGGRDGWTTVCLLLPTKQDEEVAFGLGPKYMTPALLNKRWQALAQPGFLQQVVGAVGEVWRIDPSAVRTEMLGKRTGQENKLWNKRLLLQLQRAGHLVLRGVDYERADEGEAAREWIEAELKFNPFRSNVGGLVEGPRKEELAAVESGLRKVREYLAGNRCVSLVLAALYGDNVQRVCAGCRASRRAGATPRNCPELEWEVFPRADESPRAILVAGFPDPVAERDLFRTVLRGCLERKRIKRFAATPEYVEAIASVANELYRELPLYLKAPYRIDTVDDAPVELVPGEGLVVFHLGRVARGSLSARGGTEVVHWFRSPLTMADIRYPLHERGVLDFRFFTSPDDWFRS